jgi:gallate dioxygenase
MARLVTGIGVPHTPFFPGIAKQQGDSSRMVQLFKRVRQELESAKPDLIVMLTTDHFVSFFFDNIPTFCIGAFEHVDGPHELSRGCRDRQGSPLAWSSMESRTILILPPRKR